MLALTLAVGYAAFAQAQYDLPAGTLALIPLELMPVQDNERLLEKELAARKDSRAPEFAVAIPVKITPGSQGIWTTENGQSVWRTRISSPGAKTLNLGFSEYKLPAGAELFLLSAEDRFGPFTAADNEAHNQLWTPMLKGDELIVELRVPTASVSQVQLRLSFVNHDFADVNKLASQSCNLDVVCSQADGFGIVDQYRDIIRSVAAILINGRTVCTGFLVNNVNQDGRPLFMTASHCGISATSAASVVAAWNYNNTTCRTPGSAASGGRGDGSRSVFNTGSRLLADNPLSDMAIFELDDPINPAANAFFAGWDASPIAPVDTVIAIHHPNVEEKRISFSFQNTFRAVWPNGTPTADGSHITVPDWNIGSTEGGSSGSPLFDRFKRVRGQLHGGGAACGNDASDVYGFFHTSWEGGGTPNTRLRDWLDPCGTGVLAIDGLEQTEIPRLLVSENYCASSCNTVSNTFSFELGSAYPGSTQLTIVGGSSISPSLSTASATGGQSVTVTIPGDENLTAGVYEVVVRATGGGFTDDITFVLNLVDESPTPPAIATPANGAEGIILSPVFSWAASFAATRYDVELSRVSNFAAVIGQLSVAATTVRLATALESNTTYYWRIRAVNSCGPGDWRAASFTTANISCGSYVGQDLPLPISPGGGLSYDVFIDVEEALEISSLEVILDIDHTYVGDLSATLTSPQGTLIQLFDRAAGGGCGANDLYLTLSDAAENTSGDYVTTCQAGVVGTRLAYQPAEALSAFAGEDAEGTWTLTVTDNAGEDGGAIERADLFFCTTSNLADFSLLSSTTMLDVCENSDATVVINLGADFDDEVALTADVNEQQLDNYNVTFNAANRTLTVDFSGWTALGAGNYTLLFTVTNPDNTIRTLLLPLSVSPTVTAASLTGPEDEGRFQEADITFSWANVVGVTSYVFQYSVNADFSVITYEETVNTNILTLGGLPTGESIYWRVIALNDCGNAISAVRRFSLFPVGIHDFGNGRQLSVYPNPVRDLLTVDASGAWPSGFSAQLFDATGRRMADYQTASAGRSEWNLGTVPAGVYYLRFLADGEQRTERLVVVK
jgi:subtilisin-like proprotein convertase family protein